MTTTESLLATLLPTFRFTLPTDQEIEWRFGATVTPNVKGERGLNPRMPLDLEIIQSPGTGGG